MKPCISGSKMSLSANPSALNSEGAFSLYLLVLMKQTPLFRGTVVTFESFRGCLSLSELLGSIIGTRSYFVRPPSIV
jgi:hypothetical protein